MTRQIYQNIGLIIAIVIASASLPVGIIGFMREAIVNNYYDQTYYVNNETQPEHFTYSEIINLYNIGADEWFLERVFNLTEANGIIIGFNYTGAGNLDFYLVADALMDLFYDDPSHCCYVFSGVQGIYWDIPFTTKWHLIMGSSTNPLGNVTIYLEIV